MFAEAFRSALQQKPHFRHRNDAPFLFSFAICPHREHVLEVFLAGTTTTETPDRRATCSSAARNWW